MNTTRPTDDPFNLDRFVVEQADCYESALQELQQGAKESHWMWFVFPQVARLGSSSMAQEYAIRSKKEAVAYVDHQVLGKRLLECSRALLEIEGKTAQEIMGFPDDLKLRSSMTLFAAISEHGSPFHAVLEKYFAGEPDQKTLDFLGRCGS